MALLCNDVRMEGRRPICLHTDLPCIWLRFCKVSGKYYQSDKAKECRIRKEERHG